MEIEYVFMEFESFQKVIADKFGVFDKKSSPFFLMTVLTGEMGELANALKSEKNEEIAEELADVVFAAVSLANFFDIDLFLKLEEKYLKRGRKEIAKKWSEPHIASRAKELRR